MGFEYYYEALIDFGCSCAEALDEVELHTHDLLLEFASRTNDYWSNRQG